MDIIYKPIGIIHSPYQTIEGMPIQPGGAVGIQGKAEIYPEFAEGLKDLNGFSHLILLYHFHKVSEFRLTLTPFLDSKPRGLFSTRAPKRPNPIGLSVVKLLKTDYNILYLENVDILDKTPLLDVKPYVPEFDQWDADRTGWLEQAKGRVKNHKSDDRFSE